jgi:hypothetical protein
MRMGQSQLAGFRQAGSGRQEVGAGAQTHLVPAGAWMVLFLSAVAASSAPPGPRNVSAMSPILGMPSRGAGWLGLGRGSRDVAMPDGQPRALPRTLAAANLGGITTAIEIGEGASRNGGMKRSW